MQDTTCEKKSGNVGAAAYQVKRKKLSFQEEPATNLEKPSGALEDNCVDVEKEDSVEEDSEDFPLTQATTNSSATESDAEHQTGSSVALGCVADDETC